MPFFTNGYFKQSILHLTDGCVLATQKKLKYHTASTDMFVVNALIGRSSIASVGVKKEEACCQLGADEWVPGREERLLTGIISTFGP